MDVGEQVQAYFQRLLNGRDPGVCQQMLAPDYLDDDAPAGTPPGPQATQAYVEDLLAQYPDLRLDIEDCVAQGCKVALRLRWRGMHRLTGESMDQHGIVLVHVNAQGQLTRRWSAYA